MNSHHIMIEETADQTWKFVRGEMLQSPPPHPPPCRSRPYGTVVVTSVHIHVPLDLDGKRKSTQSHFLYGPLLSALVNNRLADRDAVGSGRPVLGGISIGRVYRPPGGRTAGVK